MLPRGKAGTARREAAASGRRCASIRDANGRVTAARDIVKCTVCFRERNNITKRERMMGAGELREDGGRRKDKSCGELYFSDLTCAACRGPQCQDRPPEISKARGGLRQKEFTQDNLRLTVRPPTIQRWPTCYTSLLPLYVLLFLPISVMKMLMLE